MIHMVSLRPFFTATVTVIEQLQAEYRQFSKKKTCVMKCAISTVYYNPFTVVAKR